MWFCSRNISWSNDVVEAVDQYKIKTLKAGKIKFAARIDENINIYNFEII